MLLLLIRKKWSSSFAASFMCKEQTSACKENNKVDQILIGKTFFFQNDKFVVVCLL